MPHLDELRRLAPPPSEPVPLPAHGVTVPADYLDLVATYGQGELCDLVHLELGGLLPWGATSNGDLLCWLTDGDPDTWPTVVWDLRSREFEEHQLGATELLAGSPGG